MNRCGKNGTLDRMDARNDIGFKISRAKPRAGSSPAFGTSIHAGSSISTVFANSDVAESFSATYADRFIIRAPHSSFSGPSPQSLSATLAIRQTILTLPLT